MQGGLVQSEQTMEIYRQLRASQDKYVYFLLAAVGAAIAFALNQTQGLALTLSQIPLAISIAAWGLSFFCGCQNLGYTNSTLYANAEMLKIESGNHPEVGNHPQMVSAASQGIRTAIERNITQASKFGKLQFSLFVTGVISYVTWHTLEMWLRVHT